MQERIMNGLWSKMGNRKKNNKGFTLVELIVVIVILAILAALLVPSLIKWIDKAKEEQYALDARNILLASQARVSEGYASNSSYRPTEFTGDDLTYIINLSGLTIDSVGSVTYVNDVADSAEKHTINGMTVKFKPTGAKQEDFRVTMELKDGTWTKKS